MARNEEKAQAMLNRWYQQKKDLNKDDSERPKGFNRISQVQSLQQCERWRNNIIRDISRNVTKIQNAGLGEYRIREINDEINGLFKEKKNWENRILELGGTDFNKATKEDIQGAELPGFGGYKYFGAAKDLPGVRELFQKETPKAPKKQGLLDVYQKLDFNKYLGKDVQNIEYIEKQEKEVEEKERGELYQLWVSANKDLIQKKLPKEQWEDEQAIINLIDEEAENAEQEQMEEEENKQQRDDQLQDEQQKTAQEYMLEEKKKMLLQTYAKEVMEEDP